MLHTNIGHVDLQINMIQKEDDDDHDGFVGQEHASPSGIWRPSIGCRLVWVITHQPPKTINDRMSQNYPG